MTRLVATRLVATQQALAELVPVVAAAPRLAFDLEANGRFAYRAQVCLIQLAWDGGTAIIDALATSLLPLGAVLGQSGPLKIVHDVAFDARMLAESGIELGHVHDTALAASFLGRPATGLSSLAATELGVTLDKTLQAHDWAKRPLDAAMLAYLETDVVHLGALCDKLWALVQGSPAEGDKPATPSIEREVLCETDYRIAQAIHGAAEQDPRPVYARIKGAEKLALLELAVLRRLADVRDREARRLDVPPGELVGAAAMIDLAKGRPRDVEALRRIRGAMPRHQGYAIARELVRAVKTGTEDGAIPEVDRQWFERPNLPSEIVKRRRARETRLLAWRKKEAAARGVNEQVVLPGHCLKDACELDPVSLQELPQVPGIGAFRVERDGAALVQLLTAPPEPSAAAGTSPGLQTSTDAATGSGADATGGPGPEGQSG